MPKYLTWVKSLHGPSPQLWAEKDMTQEGKPVVKLAQHELTPLDANLPLNELANRYPYEAK